MVFRKKLWTYVSYAWLIFGLCFLIMVIAQRTRARDFPKEQKEWVKILVSGSSCMFSADVNVSKLACEVLASAEPKEPETVNALIRIAQSDRGIELRRTALLALRHEPAAYPAIKEIQERDKDQAIRQLACLILAGCVIEGR